MQSPQNTAEIILTLDIGGTFIKSAIFSDGKLIRKLPQEPSCANGSRAEIVSAITNVITQAGKINRLAVSIPGPFDYRNGIFLAEHKFASVKGCHFSEFAGNIPTCFIHDANAFLLGELSHGAARGFLRTGGITLGTGLGAAFAIGSDLQNDSDGTPAESVKLWNKPFLNGTAEDYISARALLKNFPGMSGKDVAAAAINGNIRAKAVWQEFSRNLYQLLQKWKKQLNTEVIVIGGQLSKGLFLGESIPADLNIRFSALGEDAALWGAYEYAKKSKLPENISEAQIRRAVILPENPVLYQQFLKRAECGEDLVIGVFGGSITAGAACAEPEKRYHGIVLDYLKKRYPKSNFTLINTGIGATDSIYGAFRVKSHLLKSKPDLVILDFAVNDTDDSFWAQSYEGVVRQILAYGTPIIQLSMTHNHQCNCQRFQEVIGRHYGLAMASYRDAVMPELMSGKFHWENLSPDAVHPNSDGHTFAGKLLCALLEKIPLLSDNREYTLPEKLISDEFEYTFLLEKDSFHPEDNCTWQETDGSRGSWFARRWFASTPGSSMSFSFEGQTLWISFLGLSENAGRISVRVDQRETVMIDGHFPHNWSDPKVLWSQAFSGLSKGKHRAVITLLDEHHPDGGNEFYFCAAAGTLQKDC